MRDGKPMTDGTIEEQTRACIESLQQILAEAGCELDDVVKSMVWLKRREDFPGFNAVYAEYFAEQSKGWRARLSIRKSPYQQSKG